MSGLSLSGLSRVMCSPWSIAMTVPVCFTRSEVVMLAVSPSPSSRMSVMRGAVA